jgi:hypothetical protein
VGRGKEKKQQATNVIGPHLEMAPLTFTLGILVEWEYIGWNDWKFEFQNIRAILTLTQVQTQTAHWVWVGVAFLCRHSF